MLTLREALTEAERRRIALGHFNISDLVALKAVIAAARELSVRVVVGVSEGEREFIGVRQVAALIKSIREEDEQSIFLNADHTRSLGKAEEAAQVGFDMIIFDGSTLPFEENVRQTKQAVQAVKSINPSIIVEGEIGHIGVSSAILERIPEGMSALTTPEEARQFVEATSVDVLAPAVGNMHGLLKSMVRGEVKKRLNVRRIAEIKAATHVFMTLHGGSGTDDEDFQEAIRAGITIVHVNTELRVAWRRGLERALAGAPEEVVPYKLLSEPLAAVKSVVQARLQLFNFSEGAEAGREGNAPRQV